MRSPAEWPSDCGRSPECLERPCHQTNSVKRETFELGLPKDLDLSAFKALYFSAKVQSLGENRATESEMTRDSATRSPEVQLKVRAKPALFVVRPFG